MGGKGSRVLLLAVSAHAFERFFADVMFDPFGIDFGGFFLDAEPEEEAEDDFVSIAAIASEFATRFGEGYRAIGGGYDPLFFRESNEGFVDGYVRDGEVGGQIGNTAFALGGFEFGDSFDVIFGGFGRVVRASALVSIGGRFFGHSKNRGVELRSGGDLNDDFACQAAGSFDGTCFLEAVCFRGLREREYAIDLRAELSGGEPVIHILGRLLLRLWGGLEHHEAMERAAFDVEGADGEGGTCVATGHEDHPSVFGEGSGGEFEIGFTKGFPEEIDATG